MENLYILIDDNGANNISIELNIPIGTFAKYLLNYTKKTNFKYYENNI